ncbi:MAG: S41 family peptidase [Paramuribaculum sp.]|nr:S41 family peptidase [Paramuribaculum sp.]
MNRNYYRLGVGAVMALLFAVTITAQTRSNKDAINRGLDLFTAVFKEMQTFYVDSIDAEKAVETAINSMLAQLDPYTVYMPRQEVDEFKTMNTGEFGGIGSYIVQRNGNVYISGPHQGTPAQRAGMRPGDLIVAIDGDTVLGKTSQEVSDMLKGTPGTKLEVMVKRPYVKDSLLIFNLTREKIKMPSVPYFGVERGDLGYIQLSSFTESTGDEVKIALTELKKNPAVKTIVLDLRGNPGGLLESAVKVVGNFVPKGTEVIRTKGKDALTEKVYKTTTAPVDTEIPLILLIDGESASAAEITAGALQDLDRAVIVGNRSFGKGLVQITRSLPYDGLLKVTVAKYYIPSGRLIQAIDYSHRDELGRVTRIPDSLTTEFRTAHGRIVRDGGGITPDVTVEYPEMSRIVYNIIRDMWAFDFANKYFAEHPEKPSLDTFKITDSIYEDFKNFIDPDKFNYDRVCETMLERLKETAKIEGYASDSLDVQFKVLEGMLKHPLQQDLDAQRETIEPIILREIIERYYYEPGSIIVELRSDRALEKAAETAHTPGKIKELLEPKKTAAKK